MSLSTVVGYAAKSAGEPLELFTYEAPELGDHDVRASVSHCGLCYSDIHAIDDDYGVFSFPFVGGHEIVGYVSAAGPAVAGLKVGDRVGIGWQGRSCGSCEWCVQGEVQLCQEIGDCGTWTPYGGFSSSVVVDARFVYPLSEDMAPEVAAVLLCAGITVYNALRGYVAGSEQKVGIVGVGGLGHLAIQFAHALGNEVTVISSSPGKRDEALAWGADRFVLAGDKPAMKQLDYYLDLLLCTAHGELNWEDLFMTLKKRGRIVLIGFPEMDFNPTDLVAHELSITGSFVGNPRTMREMLSFAQTHGIKPRIEVMPMSEVNEAIRRVRENRARYRIVLVNDTESPSA
jgi:uncharacterized zinc-type alcohol dehydrogenase-like protein